MTVRPMSVPDDRPNKLTPGGSTPSNRLTWAFFQHLFSGLRHFVLDTGAGYELRTNRLWSILVFVGAILATAAVWLYIAQEALNG